MVYKGGKKNENGIGGDGNMVNLVAFDTKKELCELTGLTETELWEKGFNLDSFPYSLPNSPFMYSFPQSHIASRIGTRVFPNSVSEYSVFGGTTGYTVR